MTDHLAKPSSGSGGTSAPDNTVKAIGMPNGFTSSQDLAGLEQVNSSLHSPPFPVTRTQTNYYRPGPTQIRPSLVEWCQRNDGPWTQLAPTRVGTETPSVIETNPHIFEFGENLAPSEYSIILASDSGYGTSYGAKHSVTNNSVCDESFDRNTETQSIIGQRSELYFLSLGQEPLPRHGFDHGNPRSPHQGASQSSESGIIVCEICNRKLKTKSELK